MLTRTNRNTKRRRRTGSIRCVAIAGLFLCVSRAGAAPDTLREDPEEHTQVVALSGTELWQTNSAGDDIHIFDGETGRLLQRMIVGPQPHGIATVADGSVVYVSIEANGASNGELLWIDPRRRTIDFRLTVGPEPHAIAASSDGRWVYVPCRDGSYWVVDGRARKVVTRIVTGGRPHNTSISRDDRFAYLSPMTRGATGRVTVVAIDSGHRVLGTIAFSASTRPPALTADGARLLQHVDGLNGFEVADTAVRSLVARIEHAHEPPGVILPGLEFLGWLHWTGAYRCHGLAIRPDQREVWSTCGAFVHIHRLPVAGVTDAQAYSGVMSLALPGKAYWLNFAPDGRHAYIALADRGQVAMVATGSKRIVRLLDAGRAPKRNLILETSRSVRNGSSLTTPTRPGLPDVRRSGRRGDTRWE